MFSSPDASPPNILVGRPGSLPWIPDRNNWGMTDCFEMRVDETAAPSSSSVGGRKIIKHSVVKLYLCGSAALLHSMAPDRFEKAIACL